MLFLNYLKLIKCVLRRNYIIVLEVKDISYLVLYKKPFFIFWFFISIKNVFFMNKTVFYLFFLFFLFFIFFYCFFLSIFSILLFKFMTDSQLWVYILIITNLLAKMYPNIIVYQL